MSDNNRNVLLDKSVDEIDISDRREAALSATNNNVVEANDSDDVKNVVNNNVSNSSTPKRDGLYAKKENSNYQRFVGYNKNVSPLKSPPNGDCDSPKNDHLKRRDTGKVNIDLKLNLQDNWTNKNENSPDLSNVSPATLSPSEKLKKEFLARGALDSLPNNSELLTTNKNNLEKDEHPGILKKQSSEDESTTPPPYSGFPSNLLDVPERDSIDGSETMLEIYDEEMRAGAKQKPKIPDGGWGWVVVLSSLVISMIADGVSFSFGLLYIEFLYEFEQSKATTAWIGSLFMAVPLLSGPVMSALVDRYGCRKMTIAGGLISGTGFVLSSYSSSIEVMYITFGVIAGLGLGLCYVTAVVSIAFWFDKKRTLAVGLGACGTGIGTFVYAPMTTFFIDEYGWRGTVLLLAGTFFNMIVCGAVMRDPEWWVMEQKKQQEVTTPKTIARSEGGRTPVPEQEEDFPGIEEIRNLLKSGQTPEYLLQNLRTSTEARNPNGSSSFRSVVNLPTFVKQSEKVRTLLLK